MTTKPLDLSIDGSLVLDTHSLLGASISSSHGVPNSSGDSVNNAIAQVSFSSPYFLPPIPGPNVIKLFSRKYCLANFYAKQKIVGAPVTTMTCLVTSYSLVIESFHCLSNGLSQTFFKWKLLFAK